MEGEQPRLPRSLTLEEFLEEDLGSPGSPPQPSFPPALLRPGGRAWDALAPIPPLPPTPQLSDDGEGLADPTAMGPDPGWRKPGREVLSPDTTEAPSQVPVLNALEAEESTLSDACLLDDRIGLSSAVKKLAHELRKVSITRREHAVLRKEEMDAEEARRSAIATMRPSNFERRARGGPQDVARPESERKTQELRSYEQLLRSHGAVLDDLAAELDAAGGRGVFAQRDFQEGELVLRIPGELCLQTPWLAGDGHTASALAQKLLEERQRGTSSPFHRYLQLLPELPPLHPLAAEWPPLRGALRRLYSEAQQRFATEVPEQSDASEAFRWALGMVWTRAFAFGGPLAMVPYLDLFNHWIPQHREDPLWNCRLQEWREIDAIGLVADRDIAKGEELNHLYSEASDAQLLVQHGIASRKPSANPFNEAMLEVDLPDDLRTEAPLVDFDCEFRLPGEVKRLQQLAALVQAKMDGSATMSSSEQREQLLRHWLHEEEMKLLHFAEESD